ncbi:hypothetical protein COU89_01980, partial [Candidatus Roizmanbacteria bacterium CG10_big_fil_rev_8_21_14_0_10_45_7]
SLTQRQKSIIIGSILGDGYLRIVKGRSNAYLEINHSSKQKDYVDWKFLELKRITISPPKLRTSNNGRIAYRFSTKQLKDLTRLHKSFYHDGKKVIPEKLKLDSLILAIWFMDDGSYCRQSDIYLNSQQFDLMSQQRLLKALKAIGLEAKLNKDKIYQRIRFMKSSFPKLEKLIANKLIPSMKYKLGYDPVETCSDIKSL